MTPDLGRRATTLARSHIASFVGLAAIICIGYWMSGDIARAQVTAPAPNILLIIADDMGIDASPCYDIGAAKPTMPTLSSLCDAGMVFDNVWAYPVCSPTRASILTGRYGFRTGILDIVRPSGNAGLAAEETTLQQYLALNAPTSYAHAVIGKWHLSDRTNGGDAHPLRSGVGHYAGLIRGGHDDYYNWPRTDSAGTSVSTTYATTAFTDEAITWIGTQDAPWFLWLAYTAPHTPFHLPPAELHDREELTGTQADIRQNPQPYYFAAMEAMDSEIGRLLASLSEDERANTVILFLGDNGSPARVAQAPFGRGRAKGSIFEGGVHVPLIVAGAGIEAGGRSAALINSTDLFATIAELSGVDLPAYEDSLSFAGLLDGSTRAVAREVIYTEFAPAASRRASAGGRAVRDQRHKLIEFDSGERMLFDLQADPGETQNLLTAEPGDAGAIGIAADLAARFPQ